MTTEQNPKIKKAKAARFQRNPKVRKDWVPTERDRDVVRAVYGYRALTTRQIHTLLFPSKRIEVPRKRLRALYDHHYLERIPMPAGKTLWAYKPVYRLAPNGAMVIAYDQRKEAEEVFYWGKSVDRRKKKTDVTPFFLEHVLQINDVRVALTIAAKPLGLTIDYWYDETWFKKKENTDTVEIALTKRVYDPKAKSEESITATKTVPVFPDAYFQLTVANTRTTNFFLELDRATESNTDWKVKVLSYLAYMESGTYTKRFMTTSIRILTVTTSLDRLKNLKATTENARGKTPAVNLDRFLFTTLDQATTHNILTAPIWYRATKETPGPIIAPASDKLRP